MKKLIFISCMTAVLGGCLGPVTLPARGQFENSTETFEGTATGSIDGTGTMHVKTSSGVVCTGHYVKSAPRAADGVLTCDDGKTGPFHFVGAAGRGTGYGDLNGQRFTIIFGDFK